MYLLVNCSIKCKKIIGNKMSISLSQSKDTFKPFVWFALTQIIQKVFGVLFQRTQQVL